MIVRNLSTSIDRGGATEPSCRMARNHHRFEHPASTQTLKEGLAEYWLAHSQLKRDEHLCTAEARQFFRSHDVVHVVYGCGTSMPDEAVVKLASLFGTTGGTQVLRGYTRSRDAGHLPQAAAREHADRAACGPLPGGAHDLALYQATQALAMGRVRGVHGHATARNPRSVWHQSRARASQRGLSDLNRLERCARQPIAMAAAGRWLRACRAMHASGRLSVTFVQTYLRTHQRRTS
jgi:hypothetical protein